MDLPKPALTFTELTFGIKSDLIFTKYQAIKALLESKKTEILVDAFH